MPRAYRITKKDEDAFGFRYRVGYEASALVPPLDCPSCGDVRPWGYCYPTLDLGSLPEDILRDLHTPMSGALEPITPDDYRVLEAKLAPILGADRPLSPLTGLGALCGNAEGEFRDFVWSLGERTPLVRQSVFKAMQEAGFALTATRPELVYRRERQDPLIGFEVLPSARAYASELREACKTCGFAKSRSNKNLKLDAASFDDSLPLQRVLERPDVVLVNEALAQFIREKELSDVELIPMQFN